MNRILVATDLSQRSAWAMERAVRLASTTKAQLLVLHVMDPNAPPALANSLQEEACRLIGDQLASLPAANLAPPQLQVRAGRALEEILKAAATLPADLIAIGRHEKHALLDLFRGSTGERILRFGAVPVLVVSGQPAGDYRRVLVAIDFSMPSRLALEFAAREFPAAEFHVVHAWEAPFGGVLAETAENAAAAYRRIVEQQLDEYLAGLPTWLPRLQSSIREASPTLAIREAVGWLQPDLLVLGTHGRTGVARALVGSVTESFVTDPPCDVLAVAGW